METLPGGLTLQISEGCFPLSTDSMALADFIKLPRGARVLDLGSGCGSLGLLLAGRDPGCHITGIEITETAHEAAVRNIQRNGLDCRMESLCRDLRQVPSFLKSGSFHCCISNPPYFGGGPRSAKLPAARRQDFCSTGDLFSAAVWATKFGGDFFLVQRPEQLGELIGEGFQAGFACKRLRLLHHRENGPVSLILLQLRKGARSGMTIDEISLWDRSGNPTEDYKRIYHIEEA